MNILSQITAKQQEYYQKYLKYPTKIQLGWNQYYEFEREYYPLYNKMTTISITGNVNKINSIIWQGVEILKINKPNYMRCLPIIRVKYFKIPSNIAYYRIMDDFGNMKECRNKNFKA